MARMHIRFSSGVVAAALALGAPAYSAPLAAFIVGKNRVEMTLAGTPGDPARGRALVANRQLSLCLLCHQAPISEVQFQGDISSNLAGAGTRWTAAQLRQRINDPRIENPASVMPAYSRTESLTRVAAAWRDKPILDAQQIEDIVAWLVTLK